MVFRHMGFWEERNKDRYPLFFFFFFFPFQLTFDLWKETYIYFLYGEFILTCFFFKNNCRSDVGKNEVTEGECDKTDKTMYMYLTPLPRHEATQKWQPLSARVLLPACLSQILGGEIHSKLETLRTLSSWGGQLPFRRELANGMRRIRLQVIMYISEGLPCWLVGVVDLWCGRHGQAVKQMLFVLVEW